MKRMLPLLIFIVLAGLFLYMLNRMNQGKYNPRDIPTEFIGRQAPNIDLPNLWEGQDRVRSADYQGKTWLLNVWGTWCPECWREHPFLLQLKQRGIPILAIDWRDDIRDARQFIKTKGNPFKSIGFDPNSDAVIDWGVYGAPETFLIDAQGIIRAKHAGALNKAIWQQKFAPYFEDK